MKCPHCLAELKHGTAQYTDSRKGYIIILEDVPAWICPQCGEPLFDSDAVHGIQDVLETVDERFIKLRKIVWRNFKGCVVRNNY